MDTSQAEILQDLKSIISTTFKVDTTTLKLDDSVFNGDLSLSSIQLIELIVAIEKHYNNKIPEDCFIDDNFQSISSVINLIQTHLV